MWRMVRAAGDVIVSEPAAVPATASFFRHFGFFCGNSINGLPAHGVTTIMSIG